MCSVSMRQNEGCSVPAHGARRDLPGTPGKRFAEKTTKGSVKVWARTGDMSVCTPDARGSGAGGLRTAKRQRHRGKQHQARPALHGRPGGRCALSRSTYAPTFMSRSLKRKVPAQSWAASACARGKEGTRTISDVKNGDAYLQS